MSQDFLDPPRSRRRAVNHAIVIIFLLGAVFNPVPCPFVEEKGHDLGARLDQANSQSYAPTPAQRIGHEYGDAHMHRPVTERLQKSLFNNGQAGT